MIAVCIIAACVALTAWAVVAVDLGRRTIALALTIEDRRRAEVLAIDHAALDRRVTKLEQNEKQTALVLGSRRG